MRRLFRLALFLALVGGLVWWFRERFVPPPQPPEEHPPSFRSAPHPPEESHIDPVTEGIDDLALIKGIGPVYRDRLADADVTTFAQLAAADAGQLADAVDVAVTLVEDWQDQARTLG